MRKRALKVVHVVPVTGQQSCGMYATVHDLVLAERSLGVDANIYDPRPTPEEIAKITDQPANTAKCPKCGEEFGLGEAVRVNESRVPDWTPDNGICTVPIEVFSQADLVVSHSGLSGELKKHLNCPYVHVAHGRPYSSFSIERAGQTAIYTCYKEMDNDERLIAGVTLWPEYVDYWKLLWQKTPVKVISPPCNLTRWTRDTEDYSFNGYRGKINVVVADMWRLDKGPYHVINAFRLFAEKHPGARLHVYAAKQERAWGTLLGTMKEMGIMGEVLPMVSNLRHIYSSADMVITPHNIATRIVRESMACGTQVVAGPMNKFTPYTTDPEDLAAYANTMDRAYQEWTENKVGRIELNREVAEENFDSLETARQFVSLFEGILKCQKAEAA